MKRFMVALILLIGMFSATAAEFTCLCFEDTAVIHESDSSQSIQSVHHSEGNHSNEESRTDHCKHTCSQCHFAAVVPGIFNLFYKSSMPLVSFFPISDFPRETHKSLYRPPIS